MTNSVLLVVVARRNAALGRKLAHSDSRHLEIVRRLSRSHVAAVRLLVSCSAEQAQTVSIDCAARRQDLAIAVAAVGEFAPPREIEDSHDDK